MRKLRLPWMIMTVFILARDWVEDVANRKLILQEGENYGQLRIVITFYI